MQAMPAAQMQASQIVGLGLALFQEADYEPIQRQS